MELSDLLDRPGIRKKWDKWKEDEGLKWGRQD